MPWPQFTWDAAAGQYRDSRGRFVPRADVRSALDATIDRAAADIEAVARRLQRGEVELGAWQEETERLLKFLHVASGAAAVGGWGQATPETWGFVGSRLREQSRYLRDFAAQLAAGLPLDGRFLARAGMYALSGTATYEAILRRGDLAAGYDLERRLLAPGKKEACPECVGYAALGWQPAGTLPDIGDGSRCLTRCRCRFARQRSGVRPARLPRVSPITGAIVTAFAAPEVDFADTDAGLVAGPEVEFGDFEPAEIEPEPYRPPWWRRFVEFAADGAKKKRTKSGTPRKPKGAAVGGNCGTGAGGFQPGNICAHHAGPAQASAGKKKPATKLVKGIKVTHEGGTIAGKAVHVESAKQENRVARAVGGKRLDDNEPADVKIPRAGGGFHALEIKTITIGRGNSITVHPDALLRKVNFAAEHPNNLYHTVVLDRREKFPGGAKDKYSGHEIYYRRGSGAYSVGAMHKVADEAELKRLIETPDNQLPARARGGLPTGDVLEKLKVQAEKAHASRVRKDRVRKQRLRAERVAALAGT